MNLSSSWSQDPSVDILQEQRIAQNVSHGYNGVRCTSPKCRRAKCAASTGSRFPPGSVLAADQDAMLNPRATDVLSNRMGSRDHIAAPLAPRLHQLTSLKNPLHLRAAFTVRPPCIYVVRCTSMSTKSSTPHKYPPALLGRTLSGAAINSSSPAIRIGSGLEPGPSPARQPPAP